MGHVGTSGRCRAVMVAIAFMITACTDESPLDPPGRPDAVELAAVITGDPLIGIVAATANQETFAAMTTRNATGGIDRVAGVVFTARTGEAVTMYFGADGRPAKAVMGDVVIVFANYRDNVVDVAIRSTAHGVQIVTGIQIEPGLLSRLDATTAESAFVADGNQSLRHSSVGRTDPELLQFLQQMALAWKIGACAAYAALTSLSYGSALAMATAACASALLSVISNVDPANPYFFTLDLLSDLQACAGLIFASPDFLAGCLSVIITAAKAIAAQAADPPPDPSGCGPMSIAPKSVRIGFHYAAFGITVNPSCGDWTPESFAPWITARPAAPRAGGGKSALFTAKCNPLTSARIGYVMVAAQLITVEQVGFNTTGIECRSSSTFPTGTSVR